MHKRFCKFSHVPKRWFMLFLFTYGLTPCRRPFGCSVGGSVSWLVGGSVGGSVSWLVGGSLVVRKGRPLPAEPVVRKGWPLPRCYERDGPCLGGTRGLASAPQYERGGPSRRGAGSEQVRSRRGEHRLRGRFWAIRAKS